MKYILVDENDIIIHISDTLDYQSNGNPLVDNGQLAIAKPLVKHIYNYEDEIPAKVCEAKYCYTEAQGFYKNENYQEYYPIEERVDSLEEMVNSILLGE